MMELETMEDLHQNYIAPSQMLTVNMVAKVQCIPCRQYAMTEIAMEDRMIQREAEVKNKVTAVALTDSVHNVWHQEVGKTIREWMRENCCNWVSSSEPLDTSVESMLPDCPRVSAARILGLPEKRQFPIKSACLSEGVSAILGDGELKEHKRNPALAVGQLPLKCWLETPPTD
ncbi:protein FAM172A-like [Pitangus sulphuratus]|nr:protein FAM172A-like [Pitangus sulphuratus]